MAMYVGPTGAALVQAEAAEPPVSLYASAIDDAQSVRTEIPAEPVAEIVFDRDSYAVYMPPKPTPTPEPVAEKAASAPASRPFYSGGGSASEWMAAAGIAESDWGYVDYIVGRESGWNPNATNRSSGACGLVQALPCSKVPGNGYDPVDNLRWANGYATGRYGSWAGAYDFWIRNNWW